jgi:post-segregation antitoxin (ccd killing protein)
MGMQSTISAKIDEETKKKIKKYNINASEVMRKALELEIQKKEEMEFHTLSKKAAKALGKIGAEKIVESIREDRDSR